LKKCGGREKEILPLRGDRIAVINRVVVEGHAKTSELSTIGLVTLGIAN
jgi:hypothetical protein